MSLYKAAASTLLVIAELNEDPEIEEVSDEPEIEEVVDVPEIDERL